MNKTKIKKISFNFTGEVIQEGRVLTFKGIDRKGKVFKVSDLKGIKIVSFFPAVNTSVCDLQTRTIARLAAEHPKVNFISISTDEPKVLDEWCLGKGVDNIIIVSDNKYNEFATRTNLLIQKIKKLGRGLIVLDDTDRILMIDVNKEVSAEPNWDSIKEYINYQ